MSYAYIAYTTRQKGINVLETDCINVTMEELTNEIRLTNAYPVTDEVGANTKPFHFKLTNTCGVGVDYNLNLEVMDTENKIDAKNIAVKVDENAKSILNSNPSATPTYKESDYTAVESYTTYSGSIKPYDSVTHEVRIWLDASAGNDSQNGSFYSKVVIEARQNQVVDFASRVQLGEYVEMTPTSTSYTIPKSLTGYSSDQTINPSELNLWRVININDDGTVEMVSEYTSSTLVYFTGVTGYNNLVLNLQTIAQQYANNNFTIKARHVGYNGQLSTVSVTAISANTSQSTIGCPTYNNQWWQSYDSNAYESYGCGETLYLKDYNLLKEMNLLISKVAGTANNARYFLSSRYTMTSGSGHARDAYYITESGGIHGYDSNCTDLWNNWSHCGFIERSVAAYIRPIITLNPNQKVTGDGSLEDPYILHK